MKDVHRDIDIHYCILGDESAFYIQWYTGMWRWQITDFCIVDPSKTTGLWTNLLWWALKYVSSESDSTRFYEILWFINNKDSEGKQPRIILVVISLVFGLISGYILYCT